MSKQTGKDISVFLKTLINMPDSIFTESEQFVRVDNITQHDEGIAEALKAFAKKVEQLQLGNTELFGEIAGRIDINSVHSDELIGESLSIVLEKPSADNHLFFFTLDGFRSWLEKLPDIDQNLKNRKCIEVVGDFSEFSTFLFAVKQFGDERSLPDFKQPPEKPGKLVRDFTRRHTPQYIDAWLLNDHPNESSECFETWKKVAVRKLVYCLPTEIRSEGDDIQVFFRGGRSLPIGVESATAWDKVNFDLISEVCEWIYSTPREAETKFQLLNNHIGINWGANEKWPGGLQDFLPNSFAGAKEAFAFHLQDQSKEAIKSLGELRKGLQEEVNKTQSATRDLVSALWRDFAVAGVVAALKAPIFSTAVPDTSMKALQLGVALLLLLSILVSTVSNSRFNRLSDDSRIEWKTKLYSFMSDADWKRLVEKPINAGRSIYWFSWTLCSVLYLAMIKYFLGLAAPEIVHLYIDIPLSKLVTFIHSIIVLKC